MMKLKGVMPPIAKVRIILTALRSQFIALSPPWDLRPRLIKIKFQYLY